MFNWSGKISSSKSVLNRALIIKSYDDRVTLVGDSQCDDVFKMKKALSDFSNGKSEFDCGEAGTVLRFLSLCVSRRPGSYILKGSKKLFSRPLDELIFIFSQLSVHAEKTDLGLSIFSEGWRQTSDLIRIPMSRSSQFASGVLLNSWNLDFDLQLEMFGQVVSDSYLRMTKDMLQTFGMKIESLGKQSLRVCQAQKVLPINYQAEIDMSSAFSVAAAGALFGEVLIKNFNEKSLQPDVVFPSILMKMGCAVKIQDSLLTVAKGNLKGIRLHLGDHPDMFPVLSILCAFSEGESQLEGAPHLVYKESNRIEAVSKLLNKMGVRHECLSDGIKIWGKGKNISFPKFTFDPLDDHRMAMAVGLLMVGGYEIDLLNRDCVSKSFPEFWEIIGIEK